MKKETQTVYNYLYSSLFVLTALLMSAPSASAQTFSSKNLSNSSALGISSVGESCVRCRCRCENTSNNQSEWHYFDGACLIHEDDDGDITRYPNIEGIDYGDWYDSICFIGDTIGYWGHCNNVISGSSECTQ